MKKMIYSVVAVCLLLCALPAVADTVQTLTVNGERVGKTVARMTFEGDNVVLHFSDGSTQTDDLSVVVLKLDVTSTDGIFALKGTVADKLDIDGLAPGTPVTVYDASGRTVLTAKADEVKAAISVKSLKKGVYMMKAGRQLVKFVKR